MAAAAVASGSQGAAVSGTVTGIAGGGGGAPAVDPGTVAIHRLNALEYDNTVNDLLGLSQKNAETSFISDEKGANGFDNEADAFTMTDDELQQYYNSADSIGEQVFASPTLAAKIVTCTPAGATDTACLNTVINTFGARAYRRPLTSDEVTQFQALAADAVTNGQDFNGQVKQIVKAMLTSLPFLYRIELDPSPASTVPHKLSPYDLASRLSYLVWSSMPDAQLFSDAQSGALLNDATLTAELARLMADPKGSNFTSSFAGQWLGVRDVGSHQVEPTAFPAWNETIRQAMMQEIILYFDEFLNGNLPWTQFFTEPMNFVNGPLAAFYGFKGIPATQTAMTKVMNGDPNRIGFYGTRAASSRRPRSPIERSRTYRGKWVLVNLLGENIPSPPGGHPSARPRGDRGDRLGDPGGERPRAPRGAPGPGVLRRVPQHPRPDWPRPRELQRHRPVPHGLRQRAGHRLLGRAARRDDVQQPLAARRDHVDRLAPRRGQELRCAAGHDVRHVAAFEPHDGWPVYHRDRAAVGQAELRHKGFDPGRRPERPLSFTPRRDLRK